MPQGLLFTNGLADAEPVAARHVHVAEDDLRDQLFGETEAAVAIRRGMNISPPLPKVSAELELRVNFNELAGLLDKYCLAQPTKYPRFHRG